MSLNLDQISSIDKLINISNSISEYKIIKIINTVRQYGKYVCHIRDDIDRVQYKIPMVYLGKKMDVYFEYDCTGQYLNIIIFNCDNTRQHLKITLSYNNDPEIKYLENDKSGFIPSINENGVKLSTGEYLMNFSHKIVALVGFNTIRLDDDSHLYINKGDSKIIVKLWLYKLIKDGRSWYSKFGYTQSNIYDIMMDINDVKNLKLQDIYDKLICYVEYLNSENNREKNSDDFIFQNCNDLIEFLKCKLHFDTLYNFTINSDIIDFATLTNKLYQSFFKKEIHISCEKSLKFDWYEKILKLFTSNVLMINNNISKYIVSFNTK